MEKNTEITTEMMNEITDKMFETVLDNLKFDIDLSKTIVSNLEKRYGLKKIGN